MAWVVDTCVLIDVLEDDPEFGAASAGTLSRRLDDGLLVSPVTYVELAPAFGGSRALQDEFLQGVGVEPEQPWTETDTLAAHAAWSRHIERRLRGGDKRPVADVLIGGYASRFDGLISRNPKDFRRDFPKLVIVDPSRGG